MWSWSLAPTCAKPTGRSAVLAAAAAGLVLCVGDLQPGDPVVGPGADAAAEDALAVAAPAAGGAGGALGSTADTSDEFRQEHGLWPSGRLVSYRCPRAQALSFKTPKVCARAPEKLGGDQREVS